MHWWLVEWTEKKEKTFFFFFFWGLGQFQSLRRVCGLLTCFRHGLCGRFVEYLGKGCWACSEKGWGVTFLAQQPMKPTRTRTLTHLINSMTFFSELIFFLLWCVEYLQRTVRKMMGGTLVMFTAFEPFCGLLVPISATCWGFVESHVVTDHVKRCVVMLVANGNFKSKYFINTKLFTKCQ